MDAQAARALSRAILSEPETAELFFARDPAEEPFVEFDGPADVDAYGAPLSPQPPPPDVRAHLAAGLRQLRDLLLVHALAPQFLRALPAPAIAALAAESRAALPADQPWCLSDADVDAAAWAFVRDEDAAAVLFRLARDWRAASPDKGRFEGLPGFGDLGCALAAVSAGLGALGLATLRATLFSAAPTMALVDAASNCSRLKAVDVVVNFLGRAPDDCPRLRAHVSESFFAAAWSARGRDDPSRAEFMLACAAVAAAPDRRQPVGVRTFEMFEALCALAQDQNPRTRARMRAWAAAAPDSPAARAVTALGADARPTGAGDDWRQVKSLAATAAPLPREFLAVALSIQRIL
jgi:hypothetical protein